MSSFDRYKTTMEQIVTFVILVSTPTIDIRGNENLLGDVNYESHLSSQFVLGFSEHDVAIIGFSGECRCCFEEQYR